MLWCNSNKPLCVAINKRTQGRSNDIKYKTIICFPQAIATKNVKYDNGNHMKLNR